MWDFLCLFANNTGKTRDHRNRILGSGITICVFDRSIGKLISIDSLFGKLVCYIGIRHQKKIPVWYQRFSLVFAILVCISTQVTKQHYIIDVFGGIILSEVCYLIGRKTNLYQGLWKVFEKINQRVGLERRSVKYKGKLSEIKG